MPAVSADGVEQTEGIHVLEGATMEGRGEGRAQSGRTPVGEAIGLEENTSSCIEKWASMDRKKYDGKSVNNRLSELA